MIKKTEVKEWQVLDVSDPANPKLMFQISTDTSQATPTLKITQSFCVNVGVPWSMPPEYATEFAQVLQEAAASLTPAA